MNNSHIRRLSLLLVILSISYFFPGCSSTRASLKFESLKYPASMSAFLYDQNDQVAMKGEQLISLFSFKLKKTFWAIGYGLIPLSSEGAISDSLNSLVEKHKGDGIINLSVTIDQGVVNKLYSVFLFIPSLIPVFPSSANITITGDIVKLLPSESSSYFNKDNNVFIAKSDINKYLGGMFNGLY